MGSAVWLSKIRAGDWEMLQFQMEKEGTHSEFYPFKIKVETVVHKEIAANLRSLPSL